MPEFETRAIEVQQSEYRSQRPIQVRLNESGNDHTSLLLTKQEAEDLVAKVTTYLHPASKPENQIHNYALSLMKWAVQEQFHGGTDWYEVAAFADKTDAEQYAKYLTATNHPDLPYVVSHVGTRYGSSEEH
jgi:formaldehyde-activating enzyme involved in methanogenesis